MLNELLLKFSAFGRYISKIFLSKTSPGTMAENSNLIFS